MVTASSTAVTGPTPQPVPDLQRQLDELQTRVYSLEAENAQLRSQRNTARPEEWLIGLVAQTPVAIAVLRGPELILDLINPQFELILPGRGVLGSKLSDMIPELQPEFLAMVRNVYESGEPLKCVETLIRLDRRGEGKTEDFWFNFFFHPFRFAGEHVTGVVSVCLDVTEQVLARNEVKRVNAELEQFAFVSSHDLREPLRTICAFVQLLQHRHGKEFSDETKELFHYISDSADRMTMLIDDLLSYSLVLHSPNTPEDRHVAVNLNDVCKSALADLDGAIRANNASVVIGELPTIPGSPAQLGQLFRNLLANSIRYRRTEMRPEIAISAERSGDVWTVVVSDNGIGFDSRYNERIFGLFKRLHGREIPGTGIGLAIARRVVESHGGRIRAEGRPGLGATFRFTLPALPSVDHARHTAPA